MPTSRTSPIPCPDRGLLSDAVEEPTADPTAGSPLSGGDFARAVQREVQGLHRVRPADLEGGL